MRHVMARSGKDQEVGFAHAASVDVYVGYMKIRVRVGSILPVFNMAWFTIKC